jgi:hypothetical protein
LHEQQLEFAARVLEVLEVDEDLYDLAQVLRV